MELEHSKQHLDREQELTELLQQVLEGALSEYETKEDYFKYQEIVKRCQQVVFKQMSVMLKQIKAIKKAKQAEVNQPS